jgi:hypothetical protein
MSSELIIIGFSLAVVAYAIVTIFDITKNN